MSRVDRDGRLPAANDNWDRWGADDQAGSLNLIDAEKVLQASRLIRVGRVVSMARRTRPSNTRDGLRLTRANIRTYPDHPGAGALVEDYELTVHGHSMTHLDALSHVWEDGRLWNGREVESHIGETGSVWADVMSAAAGIVTRGVLVDVVARRNGAPITDGDPLTGSELDEALRDQGLDPRPGDALVVRCGRPEWEAAGAAYGGGARRPGLAASCLDVIRRIDAGLFVTDMVDERPSGLRQKWGVHAALYALGVHLIDNADLTAIAMVAAELRRYDFMLVVAPWAVIGASGSPVNPLAVF